MSGKEGKGCLKRGAYIGSFKRGVGAEKERGGDKRAQGI